MPLPPPCSFLSLLPHPGLRCSLRCKSDERGGGGAKARTARIPYSTEQYVSLSLSFSHFLSLPFSHLSATGCGVGGYGVYP